MLNEKTSTISRTRPPQRKVTLQEGSQEIELTIPASVVSRELNNRSLFHFIECFWDVVSPHKFSPNWHIKYLCEELEKMATQVGNRKPRLHDLIINVPPGSTKTITCSIMFPAWCWTQWPWMRFICASYSSALSMESAEYCRDLIRSPKFQELYPDIEIKEDKDTKSNFKIIKKIPSSPGRMPQIISGGSRYSTSVGGTLMGFHADILIIDDPLNPTQAASDVELANANRWMEQTLPTRKTNKDNTPTILIMQRLHQDDPSGHMLAKQKENIFHISLPGEIRNFLKQVNPPELAVNYKDELLDPVRISWNVLKDLEADLGQYGYAGQIGQDPTPPGGGMFKVDHFAIVNKLPHHSHVVNTIRYWDKAGTQNKDSAYTVGVKMSKLINEGQFGWIIENVKRGRWGSHERERIMRQTADADGLDVEIWIEQEPGSGGKESAEGTIRNLAGYVVRAERPTGDKADRADPYSVQVNNGGFMLMNGIWNHEFIEEHRFFPFSTHKDQVDASSGAFGRLVNKKTAGVIKRRR